LSIRPAEGALRVVVVDDDPLVLAVTRRLLTRSGYDVVPCDQPRTALREIVQQPPFAVIADLYMEAMGGCELLSLVRHLAPGTGRVLYTAENDLAAVARAVPPLTADAVVPKSDGAELLPLALSQLRVEYDRGDLDGCDLALRIAHALSSDSVETLDHALRVSRWTRGLGRLLGLPEVSLKGLQLGALLHDVGMICVPEASLRHPGPLSDHAWQQIHQHPKLGVEMLRASSLLEEAEPIVLHHHERYDGRGYPYGLAGEAIPLPARLFALVDAWEALTHVRPHAGPRSDDEARAEIARASGSQLDPSVVELFLSIEPEAWRRLSVAPRAHQET
jgi:putative nucleotidyltransferase with HDIG domain